MRRTLLEHVRSAGEVRRQDNDQAVCMSTYNLRVWQPHKRVQDGTGVEWLPGLKLIEGEVTGPVPPAGDRLYIVLEDGRRFNFFVDIRGSVANMSGGTFP